MQAHGLGDAVEDGQGRAQVAEDLSEVTWLAEHLNAYLADPHEYRAILRNLLHLGGQITYQPTTITVTLDRPDSPRIARALQLLTDELNATPATSPATDDPSPTRSHNHDHD